MAQRLNERPLSGYAFLTLECQGGARSGRWATPVCLPLPAAQSGRSALVTPGIGSFVYWKTRYPEVRAARDGERTRSC
jgi:hypothetical protein